VYSINWLVFITETECVYCAVRTEFYIVIFNWQCHGSGSQSLASHHEGQFSIPGQSRWDFGRQSSTKECPPPYGEASVQIGSDSISTEGSLLGVKAAGA
jgi:hypothetical protein